MTLLLTLIVQAVLAGLLAPVIAREVSGQQISAGDAWRAAAPRLPSVLAATLLALLAGLGPLLVLGLIVLIAFLAGAPTVAYVAIALPGFFVAGLLSIWFSVMFSLVTPVVVLERVRPGRPGQILAAGLAQLLAGVRHPAAGRHHRLGGSRHPAAPVQLPEHVVRRQRPGSRPARSSPCIGTSRPAR